MNDGKQSTSITFFGGVNEIGGNKIALVSGNGKGVLLDFGWSFKISHDYLHSFLTLRKFQRLLDGILIGDLPKPLGVLKGIYREDLYEYIEKECKNLGILEEKPSQPTIIEEILISHGHSDHIGDIKFLHPSIKIICSNSTKFVLEQFEQTTKSNSLFSNILTIKTPGSREKVNYLRKITSLSSGEVVFCANHGFEVKLFDVDHSLPGASAYFIQDTITKIKIVYTGDLRKHGPLKEKTEEFIRRAKEFQPDVLICEGTRANPDEDRNEYSSEEKVEEKLTEIFQDVQEKDPKKLILFDCSLRDVWRLQTFYNSCKKAGKILVLSAKSYDLLKTCINVGIIDNVDIQDILVLLSKKTSGTYIPKDYSRSPAYVNILKKEEDCSDAKHVYETLDLEKSFLIKAEEIRKNPGKYVIQMSFYSLNDLFDINPTAGSYFIISRSEPFDDEGEVEERKLKNWFSLFKIPESNISQVHCSGHMRRDELINMIKEIHPKKLFPIHTTNAHIFMEMGLPKDIEIIEPEKGKKYLL
ncbi:MAG: MBL fold metallo-hydrolase [Promethearchaeota archaeon]